ncbi:hypothetical protein [Microbacterium sp. JZ31]|uniref:hypothetical protein n=1 Tax=Microbacterium sp. JZ31 TaxID=1906274 RepID=UPI001933795A|nr:hypothetical protein [Microbacterium sp. JZ31]
MKNLLAFLLGIIAGFVAAHFLNKDPRGAELLADIDARIEEFTGRIGEAYRLEEARRSSADDAPAV